MKLRRPLSSYSKSIASGVSSAVSLLMLTIATGCATSHHGSDNGASPVGKSAPGTPTASTRPDSMDAQSTNPADVLAQRAQSYSQQMQTAIDRRNTSQAQQAETQSAPSPVAPAAAAAPAQPSLVQWGDPSASHLSLLPGYLFRPDSAAPAPAAVEASPSSANPPAPQLAAMKTGPVSNSSAVVSVRTGRDATPDAADPAKAQIASIATPPETMQESAPPGQTADGQPDSSEPPGAMEMKLEKRVRDYPHDVSAQLDDQLLQFLRDEPVPNLSTISPLPDEDREMISAVMDGLSNYRNNLRADNNMLLSRKVRPLLEMADRLRALADLTIPTLALCREVRGYGIYEPWEGDPPHFSAGKDHPVILYCEVQNFSSQLGDNHMWQTALVQDAVLYTEGGMPAWTDKTQAVNDSARNRRQDFFIVQKMVLPATLPMGRYLLKVSIEDKQSHHVAEATEPLLIVAE
jgi:hypothetical protein